MTAHVDAVPKNLTRILVRLPNWLGDVVMAAPAVAAIHAARPDAELVAQVKQPFRALAERLPGIARSIPAGRDKTPRDWLRGRKALRAERFDAAVLFPRSWRAAWVPRLARIPVRLGFSHGATRRALTHRATGWRPLREGHRSAYFHLLTQAFGVEGPPPELRLDVMEGDRVRARAILLRLGRTPGRPLVALEPGASYGAAKCWPAEHFGALAAQLIEDGCDVVTVGTSESRPVERRVRALAPGLLCGTGETPDLPSLMGVLAEANVLVTNDTGPMHVAGALGTPIVALFGASDPKVSAPLGTGPREVLYEPEPCSPCFLRACPVAGHPCLTKIGPARVRRLLGKHLS